MKQRKSGFIDYSWHAEKYNSSRPSNPFKKMITFLPILQVINWRSNRGRLDLGRFDLGTFLSTRSRQIGQFQHALKYQSSLGRLC